MWNPRGCGHTPKPPARMRNEKQACFHPFCSCGTSSHCDLPVGIGWGSMSWQHSRSSQCSIRGIRSSHLKLRDLVTTSAAVSRDQFPTKGPMSKSRLFTSIPGAADSATFSYSAGREKVQLYSSYPASAWTIWESKTPLLLVSWCCWNDVLRAVQAEDGSNALLPAVGWQNAWPCLCGATPLVSLQGWGRRCVLCFCVLSSHFLVTWNWQ